MRIVVLAGGNSPERDVSRVSGHGIKSCLEDLGHDVELVDPGPALPHKLWQAKSSRCDFVWIALHGAQGEDGTVQALLDWLELPYQGSGHLTSGLAMDKELSKRMFLSGSLPTPTSRVWTPAHPASWEQVNSWLGSPVVVKPVDCGSSVGVNIVKDQVEFETGIRAACRFSQRILLESYIAGKEITVSILNGEVMPTIEIVSVDSPFYTYEAKYGVGGSRHLIPTTLSAVGLARAEQVALEAYRILGCEGLARVDLRIDEQENPWILEVNTLPGMTPTSLCPDSAAAWGLSFPDLVQRMLELGLSRSRAISYTHS